MEGQQICKTSSLHCGELHSNETITWHYSYCMNGNPYGLTMERDFLAREDECSSSSKTRKLKMVRSGPENTYLELFIQILCQ